MEGVRPAEAGDLDRIADLVAAGVAELSVMRGGEVWARREADQPPYQQRLQRALDDDATQLLVGTIDSVIVGYSLTRVETLHDGSHLGVIDDMFVEEEARGVAVGEAMVNAVLDWLRAHECIGADAMALPGHRASKNFFEESGFVARKLVMHKRLDEPRRASQPEAEA